MAADDSGDQNDLKRVKGIGVKVERRLKAEGITNLRQLARTPVTELAAILDGLPGKYNADRITREDWLSQAPIPSHSCRRAANSMSTLLPI